MKSSVIEHRVIYGDTDAMSVVYYGNYLRFFEIGRNELIRNCGVTYRQMEDAGFRLPVTEVQVRYRASAQYDDMIRIETRVQALTRVRVIFDYTITRGETVLAEGSSEHACIRADNGKPARFPAFIVEALTAEAA